MEFNLMFLTSLSLGFYWEAVLKSCCCS